MTLNRKILGIFAALMLLTLLGAWIVFRSIARETLAAQNGGDLANFAEFIARQLNCSDIKQVENCISGVNGIRLTLIQPSGKVVFDSQEKAYGMDNHLSRPEIKSAAAEGFGVDRRYSETLKVWLNYYARKISTPEGEFILRLSSPLREIENNFSKLSSTFFAWVLPIILLLFFFGIWLTQRLFSPIEAIVKTAGELKFNEESFNVKFPLRGDPEIQRLSNALNEMGKRLTIALGDIKRRREELSRIIEALPVGVVLTDTSHKIRYVNDVARDLLGETSGITKGGLVNRLLPNRGMSDMLESPDRSEEFHFPQRGKYVMVTSVSVSGAGGKLLVILDLTREKNIEEMRRNFIIDAGHEFQTPLTIIRMAAELLMDDPEIDVNDSKNLEKIIDAQKRLTELVDELLLLTKADSLNSADSIDVDISDMLRKITVKLKDSPSALKTKFELDLDEKILIKGNMEQLERAFSNIIGNAIKYSQDIENPYIKIRLKGRNVSVSDNGIGISNDIIDQIFEPFRRGDSARGKGGYGLGLSIVKRVIEAHGGKISVSNNSDAGCTFSIEL